MTFTKPYPGTFAYEGQIPSQAMNNINNAFPNILDKTGDTIEGDIHVDPSGSITVGGGADIELENGAILECDTGSAIRLETGASIAVFNGATIGVSTGGTFVSDGYTTIASTGTFTAPNTATVNVALGPSSTLTVDNGGLLTTSGTGQIVSATPGSILLAGGSSDYPKFNVARTITRTASLLFQPSYATPNDNWALYFGSKSLTTTSSHAQSGVMNVTHALIDGATVSQFEIFFITGSHGSLPSVGPYCELSGYPLLDGYTYNPITMAYGNVPLPANVTLWNNASKMQSAVFTIPGGHVVDKSKNVYQFYIVDEQGGGATAGNTYVGIKLTMSVSDMRLA